MRQDTCIRFGPYRLSTADERLWRDRKPIVLTPKAFSLLRYLAEHPGRLLTKADLLEAVWADPLVTDGSLHVCIREIRQALGDNARKPGYIETVHRRGYRFVASTTQEGRARTAGAAREQRALPPTRSAPFVGREAELDRLDSLLQGVLGGERTVAFVTGEPGIGKTSLVDVFLQRAATGRDLWIGRGQCFEHHGPGEAYQPVFEALGQLGRGDGGARVCEVLRRLAPTWFAQMPALASATSPSAPPVNRSMTQEHMLREMAEALEALTADTAFVLLLEDLHWADHATLDLLTCLAQRRGAAHLLLLATYRPVEVAVPGHPLRALKQELQARRQCQELALDLLSESAVADYLLARFSGCTFAADLAAVLHRRTDGNPLFLVNVVDQLVAQERLVPAGGSWELVGRLKEIEVGVPESVRGMLERQAERLAADEQRILEAGSVQGAEFTAAAVAAALDLAPEAVERTCAGLTRRHQFLRGGDPLELPDGSITARYQFIHALNQEVLYQRLSPRQRLRLHQHIGIWAEGAYGDATTEVAAELARHFEQGRDFRRAVQYLQQAAERAAWLLAHREAIGHARRGLKLIPRLPATPESAAQELSLRMTLGLQLQITQGFAAPDAERAYARARELSGRMPEGPQLFPVLWGLWMFYAVRPAYPCAREMADHLLRLGQKAEDASVSMHGHLACGVTSLFVGELSSARSHLEQAAALYVADQHRAHAARFGQDVRVTTLAQLSNALWMLGFPDQALAAGRGAVHWAEQLSHPHSLALALFFTAIVHQRRREPEAVRELTANLLHLATKQGFQLWAAGGMMLQGWALAELGAPTEGIALLRQGFADWRATGAGVNQPYYLALLAEALGKAGQPEEGLTVLREALSLVRDTGERYYEPELHRLDGELLLRLAPTRPDHRTAGATSQVPARTSCSQRTTAESCFRQAAALSRRQGAKSLELRAVLSQVRLAQQQASSTDMPERLDEVYSWFTEGFDTADLRDAKTLGGSRRKSFRLDIIPGASGIR